MITLCDVIKQADPPFPCHLQVVGVKCTGQVVPCHPNSIAYAGKGLGIKGGDAVAAGCQACHHEIDNGKRLTRVEAQWYQMRGFMLTYLEAVRRGCVTFSVGGKPASRKVAELPVMGSKIVPRPKTAKSVRQATKG